MVKNNSYPKVGKDAYYYKTDKEHEIGRGGFGIVYKVSRKCDQKEFAMKVSKSVLEKYL